MGADPIYHPAFVVKQDIVMTIWSGKTVNYTFISDGGVGDHDSNPPWPILGQLLRGRGVKVALGHLEREIVPQLELAHLEEVLSHWVSLQILSIEAACIFAPETAHSTAPSGWSSAPS